MAVRINEDTDFTLPLVFSALPDVAYFKVIDTASGTVLIAETPFSPTVLAHDLEIARAATATGVGLGTTRKIVFRWTYGAKQGTGEYDFTVVPITGL